MKLKGISPLEQNVDRIVLGVTFLVGVGALAYQFLGTGNMVKVGSVTVPAPQAYDPVVTQANIVSGNLDLPSLKTPEPPKYTLGDKLVIGDATPRIAKAGSALGRAPSISSKMTAPVLNNVFAAFNVPAPSTPAAFMFASTISPVEVLAPKNKGLDKLVAAQQPFDKAAVSVQATFSGLALREELQKDPDGDGPATPMPSTWWRDQNGGQAVDQVDIVAVEVERETLRLPDGSTPPQPAITKVAVPPGRIAMRAAWDESVHALGDMPGMVVTVQQAADEVQRPKYYDTIAGPEWKEPIDALVSREPNGKLNAVTKLKHDLEDNDTETKRIQELYDQAPDPAKSTDRPPPTNTGGGGGGGGGKGRGGGGGTRGPSPATTGKPDQQHKGDRVALGHRLEDLKAARTRILKKLADLGEKVDGYQAAAPGAPAAAPVSLSFLDNPEVKIWTHDMTAEPGAAYRYRMRVVINNPMFGRNLQQAQLPLAANSLIDGPWSDWSAECEVLKPDYFFFTSAEESTPGISPRPTAHAEIYRFYYGYYRQASVQVEPGDMLAGDAKLPADLKFADLDKIKAMLQGNAPPDAGGVNPAPVVPNPPEGGGGGRRGAAPDRRELAPREPPRPRRGAGAEAWG